VSVNLSGKYLFFGLTLLLLSMVAWSQDSDGANPVLQPEAEQLLALANQARAAAGVGPLKWDGALAVAARKHSLRMGAEGTIAHRYSGELDLSERAGQAGAHFDLIEENIAVGPTPSQIHNEWMNSPGHRTNMLNPQVDRVGFALVASRGVLYATADYAREVQQLSAEQVEAQVAALVRASGLMVLPNPDAARTACAMDSGLPRSQSTLQPGFVMRWQDSDLTHLPKALVDHLASRQYSRAAVGSCHPTGVDGTFTAYRVAVLLY
jgi:hypothetical protein